MLIVSVLNVVVTLIALVGGESFDGKFHDDTRSFVAPDIDTIGDLDIDGFGIGDIQLEDTPQLAEFNYDDNYGAHKWLLSSLREDIMMWNFQQNSAVTSAMQEACRKCQVSGNIECVRHMCRIEVDITVANVQGRKQEDKTAAFATGRALHSDILCSLCKHTNDVMCTMKMCIDPERGQNAIDTGVECMSGFCRWEKETVANKGFNNYYHAWWMPRNLVPFFGHVSNEIYSAYGEFISGTTKAIHSLG
ncbi:uncharacterized protein LOC128203744 [Mya arenaria]|uniref:uncharacterized protein LOC128203744 n=1 Tax=Mya arenaria TaxID=6604 RepID=UPI0022E0217A|nr:uncharacterized protein LOC128203744 [Mya arenaria]